MNFNEIIKYANDELISKGNLSVVDEVFSPDYIVHSGGKDYQGHEFIIRFTNLLLAAVSDIQVVDVEILLQAGEVVAWQRTLTGKHIANMMGALPSGQILTWRDMVVSRFENGRIAEEWNVSELAGCQLAHVNVPSNFGKNVPPNFSNNVPPVFTHNVPPSKI